MDTKQLIEAAMKATHAASLRDFAEGRPFSHVAVSRWLNGDREPDFEQVMELAELAGLDPIPTALEVRAQTKSGARFRRLLQKLAHNAGRAAGWCAFALIAYHVMRHGATGSTSWSLGILPIMFALLVARFLPSRRHDRPSALLA